MTRRVNSLWPVTNFFLLDHFLSRIHLKFLLIELEKKNAIFSLDMDTKKTRKIRDGGVIEKKT